MFLGKLMTYSCECSAAPAESYTLQTKGVAMKSPFEVLRVKEQELVRVKKEIEALRITLPLLEGESAAPPHLPLEMPRKAVELP
jgi:hypothetical protein